MVSVAVLEPMSAEMQARVREICGDLELRFPRSGDPADFTGIVGDAPYIVTRGLRFPPEVLAQAPQVKLIHQWGTGVDGIPLDAARARGIMVARSPGVNAPTVADLTLALMLAALRRIPQTHASFRAGSWEMPDLWKHSRDLSELRVGLIGMGAIGSLVARRLKGFGCDIVYTDANGPVAESGLRFVEFGELVESCDVISLHVPLTEGTRHLIGAAELRRMKPGALIVNTSRGPVIDEAALVAALGSGEIGGAALDVYETEPVAPGNPLLALDNVVTLPHVAGRTHDNLTRMVAHWSGNIRLHASGREIPANCVVVP
ncbi:MAG: 2-hydroxyacid dehydrogenase [Tropicimonas sp.]|uniref:2-hydroxyacid dehydrogenase n=1 Tax=Tropicimonas sp. TaxID=2067044 RepID=UPI003A89F793